jgi:ribosomal protein S24E
MIESDSLDRITLDSDDVRTLERFENNYYNHKNNIMQKGGAPDDFLREPIQKIIMLIFSKIKFSDKILLTFSQVSQTTKKTHVSPAQTPTTPTRAPPTRAPSTTPKRALPARAPSTTPTRAPSTTPTRALPVPQTTPTTPTTPTTQTTQTTQTPEQVPAKKQTATNQTEKSWWHFWGGSNNKKKLKKNITRLYNFYILSLNQNGGTKIHNELSLKIKKRLNKKITELKNLEGGSSSEDFYNELLKKTELVIRTDDEVKVYLKKSLRPIILQILNLEKNNIFAQYILNNIINIINNIQNFNELIIWNIIQQTMEQKKEEIKKEYEKFINGSTKSQIGGKNNNLEGGFIEILVAIAAIIIVVVSIPSLIKIIFQIIGIPSNNKSTWDEPHGDYRFWDPEKMTWGHSSAPHGQGRPY